MKNLAEISNLLSQLPPEGIERAKKLLEEIYRRQRRERQAAAAARGWTVIQGGKGER